MGELGQEKLLLILWKLVEQSLRSSRLPWLLHLLLGDDSWLLTPWLLLLELLRLKLLGLLLLRLKLLLWLELLLLRL